MKQFEYIESNNLDRYVSININNYTKLDLFPAYRNEFEKMMRLFKIGDMELISLLDKMDVRNDELVDVEFFPSGQEHNLILKAKVAYTKRKHVDKDWIEPYLVDACAVINPYIEAVSRNVFDNILKERYPFLVKKIKDTEVKNLSCKRLEELWNDERLRDKTVRELMSGVLDDVIIDEWIMIAYYDSNKISLGFLDTEAGEMFINVDAMIEGDIKGAIESMDDYYESQVIFAKQYKGNWKKYKQAVMESKEAKWLISELEKSLKRGN